MVALWSELPLARLLKSHWQVEKLTHGEPLIKRDAALWSPSHAAYGMIRREKTF